MVSCDGAFVFAPAKINLYLHIVGRRVDGFHLLNSVFAFTDLADRLDVYPDDRLRLDIAGPWAQSLASEDSQDNLVLRAARLLRDEAADPTALPGAHLVLTKTIPVAAGVGGGSADAAAALKLLARYWKLSISDARLHELAQTLGADVPPCLTGRPSYVRGIGENVTPLAACPDWGVILVNPRVPISTPDVFQAYKKGRYVFSQEKAEPGAWNDPDWLLTHSRNDLEAPALAIAPVIGDVLEALKALPSCLIARMSGSGATCFALFDKKNMASEGAKYLSQRFPQWWCWGGGFHLGS